MPEKTQVIFADRFWLTFDWRHGGVSINLADKVPSILRELKAETKRANLKAMMLLGKNETN